MVDPGETNKTSLSVPQQKSSNSSDDDCMCMCGGGSFGVDKEEKIMDPNNNNHPSKPSLESSTSKLLLQRSLFAQLYHILIGQDVVLATPLRLVFRTPTPYPGVGKFRQNGFVQPVAKFFNRRTFRV
jgi:hypothetical protein